MKSDGNPFSIRNGDVSVSIYSVCLASLVASALNYAQRTGKRVRIWSNDYRSNKEKRYAHLENIVLPDGRSDSPYIMRCEGGVWCHTAYPNYLTMQPIGRSEARKAYEGARGTSRSIYQGWQNQPEVTA